MGRQGRMARRGGGMLIEEAMRRLPEACLPTKANGKWRKPAFSALKIARLRKVVGAEVDTIVAAARPKKEPSPWSNKPNKGHKYERERPERMAKIASLLARQDEFVATMKKTMKAQSMEKQIKKSPKPY